MFSKDELLVIFDVFSEVESEKDDVKILKEKMKYLRDQYLLSEDYSKKITDIQDKISALTKKEV